MTSIDLRTPRPLVGLCVALVALVVSSVLIPSLASADRVAFDCESIVVDNSTQLGDATPVVIAASDAEKFGPVRVRVWDSTPGSLDDALAQLAADCGWVDVIGNYVGDLLVIGVSIDDKATRVKYGPGWAPSLDDSIDVILNRIMNPQFGEGAYTAGLTVGLEQMAARRGEVDGVPRVTTAAPAPTTSQPTDGATETTVAPPSSEPESTFLLPEQATTIEPPVEDPPDAIEEEVEPVPTSIVVIEDAPEPVDPVDEPTEEAAQGEAQLVPNIEQEGSGLGVYLLIAAVLAAVFLVPLILLKRGENKSKPS